MHDIVLLTCLSRSFALRIGCWREDLWIRWSIHIVVIDRILKIIVIAHCQLDRDFTFFVSAFIGRSGSGRRWIYSNRRRWHSLSGFAVVSNRISISSRATTIWKAERRATLRHDFRTIIQLHVCVDNSTKSCCLAVSTCMIDLLVPVFVLLLGKLLLSSSTYTTLSFELQLCWVSLLVVHRRWISLLSSWQIFHAIADRWRYLVWTTTWVASACISMWTIVLLLCKWLTVIITPVHVAGRGDHHTLHSIDMVKWGELFLCFIASMAFSLGPYRWQHIYILTSVDFVLVLVHTIRWYFTWLSVMRMIKHVSHTLCSSSKALINSAWIWQSSYLYEKLKYYASSIF